MTHKKHNSKEHHYTSIIIALTIIVNLMIVILFFMPKQNHDIPFDRSLLPRLNAIFNSFTFIFLLAALFFILRKRLKMDVNFLFVVFTYTSIFLLLYSNY